MERTPSERGRAGDRSGPVPAWILATFALVVLSLGAFAYVSFSARPVVVKIADLKTTPRAAETGPLGRARQLADQRLYAEAILELRKVKHGHPDYDRARDATLGYREAYSDQLDRIRQGLEKPPKAGDVVPPAGYSEAAFVLSQSAARAHLEAPETAEFPSYIPTKVTRVGADGYTIRSYVDSQKGAQKRMRTMYTAVVREVGDELRVESVVLHE